MQKSSKIKLIHPMFFEIEMEIIPREWDKLESSTLYRQNTTESLSNMSLGSTQFATILQHLFTHDILPTPDYVTKDLKSYAFYSQTCCKNYYKNKKKQQIRFNNSKQFTEGNSRYKLAPQIKQAKYCRLGSTYFIIEKHQKQQIYTYFQHQFGLCDQSVQTQKNKAGKPQEKNRDWQTQKLVNNKIGLSVPKQRIQEYQMLDLNQLSLNKSQSQIDIDINQKQSTHDLSFFMKGSTEQHQHEPKSMKDKLRKKKLHSPTKSQIATKPAPETIINYESHPEPHIPQLKKSIIFDNIHSFVTTKMNSKLGLKQKQHQQKKQKKNQFVTLKFSLNGQIIAEQFAKKMTFVRNQFLHNYDVYFDEHFTHKLEQKMIMAVINKTFYCKQKYELVINNQQTQGWLMRAQTQKDTEKLRKHLSEMKIGFKQRQPEDQQDYDQFQIGEDRLINEGNQFNNRQSGNKYFRIQKKKSLFLDQVPTQPITTNHNLISSQRKQKPSGISVSYKRVQDIMRRRKEKEMMLIQHF